MNEGIKLEIERSIVVLTLKAVEGMFKEKEDIVGINAKEAQYYKLLNLIDISKNAIKYLDKLEESVPKEDVSINE